MFKESVPFVELAKSLKSPYSVKLSPHSCDVLDSRTFSIFVTQYASWVEDGIHVVIRQLFDPQTNVSQYLLLTYPAELKTVNECGHKRERRTLLCRLRFLLRCLALFANDWQRFEEWRIAGLKLSLDVFREIIHGIVPRESFEHLDELIERFELLWSPRSPIKNAAEMKSELTALVDLADEAFTDLHTIFLRLEEAIARTAREAEKAKSEATMIETVKNKLDTVSDTTEETIRTVRRIEGRQCRRAGVSVPVSLKSQEACLALWNAYRFHPEQLSVDVAGRMVNKADVFDSLHAAGRLPHGVSTLTDFTRAIDLARKRQRKKDKDNRKDNHEDNHEDNREDNPTTSSGDMTYTVLDALKQNSRASIRVLSKKLSVSHTMIERIVKTLRQAGQLRREGGTRGKWIVNCPNL